MLVSKLIAGYEISAGSYKGLDEHLRTLASIGEEFVTPNNISPEDFDKLANSLGALLKLMKKQGAKEKDLKMVKTMIANISTLATKKVSQRKPELNEYIINLGDDLINLKHHLSTLLGPALISAIFEYYHHI